MHTRRGTMELHYQKREMRFRAFFRSSSIFHLCHDDRYGLALRTFADSDGLVGTDECANKDDRCLHSISRNLVQLTSVLFP